SLSSIKSGRKYAKAHLIRMFKSHQMISRESLRWLVSVLLMYFIAYIRLLKISPPRLLASELATFEHAH
ncbi:hypothetical protein, partial [Siminovitchia terrae]|uniref:hypothetical protein n=1 Tax=Siminovitchia terrae TaxID=1914933 RepID=UPI0028B1B4EE